MEDERENLSNYHEQVSCLDKLDDFHLYDFVFLSREGSIVFICFLILPPGHMVTLETESFLWISAAEISEFFSGFSDFNNLRISKQFTEALLLVT